MSTDGRLQSLLMEWEERRERGEDPSATELCRDCPELIDPLRAEIAKLRPHSPTLASSTGATSPARTVPAEAFAEQRYRPTEYVASGGLGDVFKAEDTELGREVALKRIRADRTGAPGVQERFRREAEITGRLEHPGIVPIYGLGHDANGQPYYGMRFIRGRTLKEAIDEHHALPAGRGRDLALRQLLTRFVTVCQTVAYAHSKGVIHRDLKPANVMLGPYGETLVVDWGLAKLVGRGGPHRVETEETLLPSPASDTADGTRTGQALGTPAFMSPEQANGHWDEAGPASDVFGLGAVLYCLLTGRPPYTGDDALASARHGEFPLPCQVRPEVPKSLQAVCLTAMAPKPAARYATALDLAADVEHWLADEPVAAYRDPLRDRLWRWARRRRTVVVGAAVLLVTATVGLAIGFVVVGHEQRRTEQERVQTAKERDEKEAARALEAEQRRRTRAALDDMLADDSSQWLTTQKVLLPQQRAFLEKALRYYQEFAAQEPGEEAGQILVARAYLRVGQILKLLGQVEEARQVFERAANYCRQLFAAHTPSQAFQHEYTRILASFGLVLDLVGRATDAERVLREALPLQARLVADHPADADSLVEFSQLHDLIGILSMNQGRLPVAEQELRAALRVLEGKPDVVNGSPECRLGLAHSHSNLGVLFRKLGRVQDAERENRAAVALMERLVAEYPARSEYRYLFALRRVNLGNLLSSPFLSQPEEGAREFRLALAEFERLAADHPAVPDYRHHMAKARSNLGATLDLCFHRYREAEQEYQAAVKSYEWLAMVHPTVIAYQSELAHVCNTLGQMYLIMDEPAKADQWSERAIRTLEAIPAGNRDDNVRRSLIFAWWGKAEALMHLDRYGDSLAYWDRVIASNPMHGTEELRFRRAVALAHVGALEQATREAELLTAGGEVAGGILYGAAWIFAVSAGAEPPDPKRREGHAARAVALLARARAAGYFKDPARTTHLKTNSDLVALRNRDDFRRLLAELDRAAPTPSGGRGR